MFSINIIKENQRNFLELKNSNKNTKAIISLHEGGRLQELQFERISVIKDQIDEK